MKQVIITIMCTLSFSPIIGYTINGNSLSELWSDQQFQKEISASYGIIADYEPDMGSDEIEI